MISREVAAARDTSHAEPGHTSQRDASPVAISVVHASLDLATYALMIGTFTDEPLSGIERFIDRQFGGLLSTWIELDRYPTALGTSRFVPPAVGDAQPTEPPGCYVVGLGRSIDFGRAELAHAVRNCLVDRCLALYALGERTPGTNIRLGVSSTLMGVGAEEGLRVEDSVAGIVDGVLRANDDLAQYEASRSVPVAVPCRRARAHRALRRAGQPRRRRRPLAGDQGRPPR